MSNEKNPPLGQGTIGPVRFSFLNVFKPKRNEFRDENEYSAVLLIPKLPTEQCPNPKEIGKYATELVKAVLTDKFGTNPGKWDNPIKDGDVETNGKGDPAHPGYHFIRVRAREDYPPKLIDGNMQPVTGGWVSGDWGIAKVAFYASEHNGVRRVSAGLRAIQFTRHDEPFGGGGDPLDGFSVVPGADASNVTEAEAATGIPEYSPWDDE